MFCRFPYSLCTVSEGFDGLRVSKRSCLKELAMQYVFLKIEDREVCFKKTLQIDTKRDENLEIVFSPVFYCNFCERFETFRSLNVENVQK